MKVRTCFPGDRHFWAFAQACPCPAPGPGRPGPAARSQHYLFHGFQLTNKVTKRKDKSMCARRDAIAQRSSPGLASNRSTVKPLSPPPRHLHQVRTDASVTIRLLIPTPCQRVSRISAETDDLAKSGSARPAPLAPSELRRMFCSDEGAGAAIDNAWQARGCRVRFGALGSREPTH